MKYFLPIILFWSANLLAADECSSVWVYQPYKTCEAAGNGLNLNENEGPSVTIRLWSQWLKGGADQLKVCADLRDEFNHQNLVQHSYAKLTSPTPIREATENHLIMEVYRYQCELEVKKYPFQRAPNAACGAEEKYSYKVGGDGEDLPGHATCLSCDDKSSAPPEQMVECLHDNIQNIIKPKAIDLRDSDLKAVDAQVRRILNLRREVKIGNLNSTGELYFFSDFLSQVEGPAGHGGGGGLPKLQ